MGPVEQGVTADIERLGLDPEASGLAATALVLARALDGAEEPREAAVVGRELRAVLAQMGVKPAGGPRKDIVDELSARRPSPRSA
jgi:tellurite resistance protein